MPHAAQFIEQLAVAGKYHFTTREAAAALKASDPAVRAALRRLEHRGKIASPAKSFYVIVPPEYRRLGCLPAEQFIPQLMKHLDLEYYVGLLSAAQYHGAAHHRPQEFQVMLAKHRRPLLCGLVRVAFIGRANIGQVSTIARNTPRGIVRLSSVEATAVDLAGYPEHAGGLDGAATVLSELLESLDPEKLVAAARSAPVPWAQRLGYLLESAGGDNVTEPLALYVRQKAREYVPLVPGASLKKSKKSSHWRLRINAEVEPEA